MCKNIIRHCERNVSEACPIGHNEAKQSQPLDFAIASLRFASFAMTIKISINLQNWDAPAKSLFLSKM